MGNEQHLEALINRIRNIDDQNVLEEIHRLLDIDIDDTVYPLNREQESEIDQARKEIARGEGIPSNEIEKEFDEWLNK